MDPLLRAELVQVAAQGFLYALVFLIALRTLTKRAPRLWRDRLAMDPPGYFRDQVLCILSAAIAALGAFAIFGLW